MAADKGRGGKQVLPLEALYFMCRDQEIWLDVRREAIGPHLEAFEGLPPGKVRREARAIYRAALEDFRRKSANPAKVTRYDPQRGFGFIRLQDNRTAFLHKSVQGTSSLKEGDQVNAVVVPSLDRKKNKPGWKAIWLDTTDTHKNGNQ